MRNEELYQFTRNRFRIKINSIPEAFEDMVFGTTPYSHSITKLYSSTVMDSLRDDVKAIARDCKQIIKSLNK